MSVFRAEGDVQGSYSVVVIFEFLSEEGDRKCLSEDFILGR